MKYLILAGALAFAPLPAMAAAPTKPDAAQELDLAQAQLQKVQQQIRLLNQLVVNVSAQRDEALATLTQAQIALQDAQAAAKAAAPAPAK